MTIRRYMRRGELFLPEDTILIPPLKTKIGGFFRVQLRRKSGSLKYDTGWFHNLITNLGMDLYGRSTGFSDNNGAASPSYCCVGTGTSAPSVSDTALVAPLAFKGFSIPTIPSYVAGPPAYSFQSLFWAFPLGSVIGNISEISAGPMATGVGNPSLANCRAYSRQLILDSLGNPTTISVTSGDQLNTSYQLRLYFDLTDSTTSINISGPGGGTFGGTIRRSQTSSFGPNGVMNPSAPDPPSWGTTVAALYTGPVGTTSSSPGGTSLSASSHTYGIYTPGTFTRTVDSFWGTTNLGTVQALKVGSNALGFWQANMAPGFAKTGSNTLHINWSMAWARF